MGEPELTEVERRHLLEAVSAQVPDGFADRVLEAFDETPHARPESRARRRDLSALAVAVMIAAALVLLLGQMTSLALRPESREAEVLSQAELTQRLRARCGGCHDGGSDQARAEALSAFDLARDDWQGRVSGDTLERLLRAAQ